MNSSELDLTENFLKHLPAYETVRCYRAADHVVGVELARPDSANALNTQMGHDLLDVWTRLTAEPLAARCVLLGASGTKIFCAGGDLKERNGMTRAQWIQQHELFERMFWTLVDLPQPVIAAVNGHAFGGGLEMALCCDFIYAGSHVRFGLPEVGLGIMPGGGGTQNLPRAVGERRAKEILLSGAPFDAEKALRWGLVNEVFSQEELPSEALQIASRIAGNAPLSTRQIKKSVRYGTQMELRTAYRFEIEAYNHLIDTEDRMEGVLAFNEKRAPRFKGV
ncbi:enoyl-CoA hydratase/isomerase family protein [Ottowia thiooxydans]|uniref:Enoyl-CoA hydratase n=1 Tax=Ottowia thiooxydans TaxID=219182 RepID=A0ABV2Q231_9BURK